MSLTYYDDGRKPKGRLANALLIFNALMAFGMAFYWSGLAGWVGEPFRWAMRRGVSLSPSLFEYPYLMLWLAPLLCMCGGWLALKTRRDTAARIIGACPTLMLALMLSWFYLTPPHWH